MKPNTVTDIPSRNLKSIHTTALTIPQSSQPLRLGSINLTPWYETLRLCLGVLAQLAAEDVGHVFQGCGLVSGRDEEPDEDEGEGVEAGEDAQKLAVAPVDAEGNEEGEQAGAGEVPEGGP